METAVFQRGDAKFDMVGRALPFDLSLTDRKISQGLAKRIAKYASDRLLDAGFDVSDWVCEVSTTDAELPPSERCYAVTWTNPKGGQIGVEGILTARGWPFLDHGAFINS